LRRADRRPDLGRAWFGSALSSAGPIADIGLMHARIRSTFALALLTLCAAVPAQQKPQVVPQPAPQVEAKPAVKVETSKDAALDREIEAMREKVKDGKAFRSHVRVTVRLKNGNRVQGIVKDGFVVERIDGMRFVSAEANDEGAGVRIYTYNGKRNYVFLAFSDMQEYRINARLSTAELAAYERKVKADEETKRKELLKQLDQNANGQSEAQEPQVDPVATAEMTETTETLPPVKSKKGSTEKAAEGAEEQVGVAQELQGLYALLQAYPPAEGWNATRRDEIARRRAVVGANPSPKEQKFVEQFENWKRACEVLGAKPIAEQGAASESNSTDASKKSRKNRR
jgi:hypothetical protein